MTVVAPAPEGPRAHRVRASWWSVVVLVLAAIPRSWAALWDGGVFLPDETFQTLEPAHHLAFGWGMMPHEFREGARSWLFPGVLGVVWKIAARVGVQEPASFVGIARVGMATFSLVAVWFAMALARRLAGERAAIVAGLLVGACPPLIALGTRTFTEVAAAPLIALAALLVVRGRRRDAALAGVAAGVTIFLGYPNALLVVGFLGLLFAQGRTREASAYATSASATAVFGGLLDWPTWGWPFHALWGYLGSTPATTGAFPYYEQHLSSSIGLTYALLLVGLVLVWRRARGLVLIVVGFVVALSFPNGKELRLLLPVLPLAVALAAVGLTRLMDGVGRRPVATYLFALGCAAQMTWVTHDMTRGELGFGGGDWVIWHSGADYLRVTEEAGAATDLCGIIYVGNEPSWTGGYSYLHRPVPIFFDMQGPHLAAANYIVGAKTDRPPTGWRSVHTDGGYALFRRDGTCTTPPRDWSMSLP